MQENSEGPKMEQQASQEESSKKIKSGVLPNIPEYSPTKQKTGEQDMDRGALKIGWIGAGQGGCRLVDCFYNMGYSNCIAVNTTEQDLSSLSLPHKLCVGSGSGAGKDLTTAMNLLRPERERVFNLIEQVFPEDLDLILVTVGAGGGTGSGFAASLIEMAQEYFRVTKQSHFVNSRVGALVSLPKESEGSKVMQNAHTVISELVVLAKEKKISPLIVIDNEKIPKLLPKLPVRDYWHKVNEFICKGFHTINKLASLDSEFTTFDKADLLTVMESGIVTYGHSSVTNFLDENALTEAIKKQLSNSLLADCNDFGKASHAALCVVASTSVINQLDMSSVDHALMTMKRMMGTDKNSQASVLHTGIYEYGDGDYLKLFSIIGGVSEPTERIQKLKQS